VTTDTVERSTARERLLAAASELFYAEGVHSVGIDRVIERAGVAKATLYSTFGSKDDLVRAYLEQRHLAHRERMTRELAARFHTPRERLLGVFDLIGESFADPGFRGCAYVNASAEPRPGSGVTDVSAQARAWRRDLLTDLSTAAGAPHPDSLARQLGLIYDGATVAAGMDRDVGIAVDARAMAAVLLDAELEGRTGAEMDTFASGPVVP
jgi:AcrR family transcriptional regulator